MFYIQNCITSTQFPCKESFSLHRSEWYISNSYSFLINQHMKCNKTLRNIYSILISTYTRKAPSFVPESCLSKRSSKQTNFLLGNKQKQINILAFVWVEKYAFISGFYLLRWWRGIKWKYDLILKDLIVCTAFTIHSIFIDSLKYDRRSYCVAVIIEFKIRSTESIRVYFHKNKLNTDLIVS